MAGADEHDSDPTRCQAEHDSYGQCSLGDGHPGQHTAITEYHWKRSSPGGQCVVPVEVPEEAVAALNAVLEKWLDLNPSGLARALAREAYPLIAARVRAEERQRVAAEIRTYAGPLTDQDVCSGVSAWPRERAAGYTAAIDGILEEVLDVAGSAVLDSERFDHHETR